MKRFVICILSCLVLSFALAAPSFCETNKAPAKQSMLEKAKNAFSDLKQKYQKKEEKKPEPQPIQPAQKAEPEAAATNATEKEMTKENMVSEIKETLMEEDEVLGLIQGLKAEKDKAGNVSYSYNGVSLENISEGELGSLLNRARQMAIRLRTERIQEQLETVRQVQRLRGVSVPPRVPAPPPAVPRPPSVPSQPPSAHKAPPAAPPSSRR